MTTPVEKTHIQRGDIYYIVEDPNCIPYGSEMWPNRAALVVSNEGLCKTSRTLSVVWLTTSSSKYATLTHIPVTSGTKKAIAICEHPETVDISRFRQKFGHISDNEQESVDAALMFGLQLNTGINPQGIFKKYEMLLKTHGIQPDIMTNPINTITKYQYPPKLTYSFPYDIDITSLNDAKHTIVHMCDNCPLRNQCTALQQTRCDLTRTEICETYNIPCH